MQIYAFWQNDQPDGCAVRVTIATEADWQQMLTAIKKIIAAAPDPQHFALSEIRRIASFKHADFFTNDLDDHSQTLRLTFAAFVAIAAENQWMADDEYNGIRYLRTL